MNAAIFDTNVLVSGMLSPHGAPGWLVDALLQGICRAVVDDRVWDEYVEVLNRPVFDFPPADTSLLLERISAHAIHAPVTAESLLVDALPDPDDAPFLACAATLHVPLVTGNLKHFPHAAVGMVEVLAPAAYIRRLRASFRV